MMDNQENVTNDIWMIFKAHIPSCILCTPFPINHRGNQCEEMSYCKSNVLVFTFRAIYFCEWECLQKHMYENGGRTGLQSQIL